MRDKPFLTRFEQDAERMVGVLTRGEPRTPDEWNALIRACNRLLEHAEVRPK